MRHEKIIVAILLAFAFQDSALAGFTEGANAYNAKDYALALKEIIPLAKAGHADSQHLLGLMHYMGRGVTRDYKQALTWHRKAALQGKADAQYVVGAMYYTGNSVPQDHKLAVSWFRKAAEQGHAEAQHALGLMYRYHVAGATYQRAAIARQMTPEQIEEGQSMSRAWHPGTPLPTQSRTGNSS